MPRPLSAPTRYRSEDGRSCIDLNIRHSRQLFDGRDPAPFKERDLDDDAVTYLRGATQEISRSEPLAIVVTIASRVLARTAGGNLTVFAFDARQELSEHTTPFDAIVFVLEGTLTLTTGGAAVRAAPGTIVRMPAHIPHAVEAREAARMLLIMLRDTGGEAATSQRVGAAPAPHSPSP